MDDWSGVPMDARVVPSQPCWYFQSVSALIEGEAEAREVAMPRTNSEMAFMADIRVGAVKEGGKLWRYFALYTPLL